MTLLRCKATNRRLLATSSRIWGPFVLCTLASQVVYRDLTASPLYFKLLALLALINFVLAARILRQEAPRTWWGWAVVGGLLVGQWWLILFLLAELIWSIRGFAP